MSYPQHAALSARALRRGGTPCLWCASACWVAVLLDDTLVGFGYGYTTRPGQWWHDLVRKALNADSGSGLAEATRSSCRSCMCCPISKVQGRDGASLRELANFAATRSDVAVDAGHRHASVRDDRHLGFVDLRRHYLFPGDVRPFAVLGAKPAVALRWRLRSPGARPVSGGSRVCSARPVLAQIAYPLTSGDARDAFTIATVLLVAAASLVPLVRVVRRTSASPSLDPREHALGGFAVEVLGVHTGVPFGDYHYTGGLGVTSVRRPGGNRVRVADVARPAVLAARRVCRSLRGARRSSAPGRSRPGICSSIRKWWRQGTGRGRPQPAPAGRRRPCP